MSLIKNCPVCRSDRFKKLFDDFDRNLETDFKKFTLVKCKNCGLGFINPQPSSEELERYYSEKYFAAGSSEMFSENSISLFLSKAKNFFSKLLFSKRNNINHSHYERGRLLDFGCGTGRLISKYKMSYPNYEFYGADISWIACEEARKIEGVNIFCGALEEAHFKDNFFDFINVYHVLEHLPNLRETLVELNRVLKPGGKISIS
ncbi:MAG: class I SAM-dependent methyltransferase, partial [Spirochaetota bacterium]